MRWFADAPLLTLFFCVGVGSLFGRIGWAHLVRPGWRCSAALALSAIEPGRGAAAADHVVCRCVCSATWWASPRARRSWPRAHRLAAGGGVRGGGHGDGQCGARRRQGLRFDIRAPSPARSLAARARRPPRWAPCSNNSPGRRHPAWPAIGYAVAYPITVLLTILACSYLISAGKAVNRPAEDRETVRPRSSCAPWARRRPGVHGGNSRPSPGGGVPTDPGHQTVVAHEARPLAAGTC